MRKSINFKTLEGMHALSTIQKLLKVSKATAIKELSLLRKKGFVKTFGGGKQPRLYLIHTTPRKEIGNPGLYETINKYSPVKITGQYKHRIVGKKLSVEEALIRAIATREIKTVLASLGLFNRVSSWSRLYRYAKEYGVRRKIGALYDVARTAMKVRKMDQRIRKRLLKAKERDNFIILNLKSKDFKNIERIWKVYVPFNNADLEAYKEWLR